MLPLKPGLPQHLVAKLIFICMLAFTVFYLTTTCTKLPSTTNRPSTFAISNPEITQLGMIFENTNPKNSEKSGFSIVHNCQDAFANRIGLTALAEKTLDIQYYVWENDTSGNVLAEHVLRAAERGVRVRILIDGLNFADRDKLAASFAVHENIEIRVFNPALNRFVRTLEYAVDFNRLNKRMHNKLMVMDNACAIIGGRNIADNYFGLHSDTNMRDLDIVAAGPIVQEASSTFDEFWNSQAAVAIEKIIEEPVDQQDYLEVVAKLHKAVSETPFPYPIDLDTSTLRERIQEIANSMIWAKAEIFYDSVASMDNSDEGPTVYAQLQQELLAAQKSVLIESAYFVMREDGIELAKLYKNKGVDVRVLTNSLASNDVTAAQASYKETSDNLLREGFNIFEFRPDAADLRENVADIAKQASTTLHTKALVIDRKRTFVGSYNLDPRSAKINSEIGLFIESEPFAEQICQFLDSGVLPQNAYHLTLDSNGKRQWSTTINGQRETWDTDPSTSALKRFKSDILEILPIDGQF
ncbi:phospholipase D family protein [Rubritalea spongiae]|uniref:Phospholipase D family protein n=1 Tax=Rubritalea spongiae TaxID=430797 RepID=A0ABW5E152_9BACT